MLRKRENRVAEHQVSCYCARESPGYLCSNVRWHFLPAYSSFEGIHKGDGRIKVGTGNASECKNQSNESRTRGYRVCEKRNRHVARGEPLPHDPRTDNSGH